MIIGLHPSRVKRRSHDGTIPSVTGKSVTELRKELLLRQIRKLINYWLRKECTIWASPLRFFVVAFFGVSVTQRGSGVLFLERSQRGLFAGEVSAHEKFFFDRPFWHQKFRVPEKNK